MPQPSFFLVPWNHAGRLWENISRLSWSEITPYVLCACTGGIVALSCAETSIAIWIRKALRVLSLGPRGPQTVFDLEHQLLNLEATSSWVNLGYWKQANMSYREGCEALADRLAQQAGLKEGDAVLDIGYGCGDQDLYWYHQYALASVHGINVSHAQVASAQGLVARNALENVIHLRHGIASDLPYDSARFDKVLSLDSAYHYRTREAFFHQAFRVLRSGGILAIADMVPQQLPTSFIAKTACDLLAEFSLVPKENLYDMDTYIKKLEQAGFVDIQLECVEDMVFEGFADFVERHHSEFAAVTNPIHWGKYTSAAKTLRAASKKKWFHYIMVSAKKP
eukprot:TRINITY_DN2040_c0_g4_i1.p1 TRINITY_DN2040_c0_g4~~TRINITY_DN2040_c0_g4_i1.p1  ORF type:complete len:337 (-),score=33.54 TRINITY_DN2040_c0_g4_i1:711-1721(-)